MVKYKFKNFSGYIFFIFMVTHIAIVGKGFPSASSSYSEILEVPFHSHLRKTSVNKEGSLEQTLEDIKAHKPNIVLSEQVARHNNQSWTNVFERLSEYTNLKYLNL